MTSNGAILSWSNVSNQHDYEVQVSTSSSFTSGVTTYRPSDSSSSLFAPFFGRRYIRIRARDRDFANVWTDWRYGGSLTVDANTNPL